MSIRQYVSLFLLPLDALSQVFPQSTCVALVVLDFVHQLVVVVQLNHARTTGKGAAHLTNDSVVIHILGNGTPTAQDESVSHQCVDRTNRRSLYEVLINQTVAIGNPALTVGALVTCLAVITLLTPYGICEVEPEWRSPGSYCGVEEDVWTLLAYGTLDADDGLGILLTSGSFIGTDGRSLCTDAIKLEEAEVVTVDHVGAATDEEVVVILIAQLHATL